MNRWLTVAFLLASVVPAIAADQIKLVLPFAAGGPVDLIARAIAGGLPAKLGADVTSFAPVTFGVRAIP